MNENRTNVNWLMTILSNINIKSHKIWAKRAFTNYTFLIKSDKNI